MNIQEAILKVQKLLAKGNDKATSPEEAAAFLAKANQIMDDYKLNVDEVSNANQEKDDNEPIRNFYDDPLDHVKYGNYRETWTRTLANVLATHNQTRTFYTTHADRSISIKIIGRGSDVQVVRYLYSFFKRQIEQLADEGCSGNSTAYRGQFCMGVIDTLWRKLLAERKQTIEAKKTEHAQNSMALIRVNQAVVRLEKRSQAVEKFMEENLNLRKGRGFNPKTETGGRGAGRLAGEKLRMTGAKGAVGAGHKQLTH